ncbi:MAG: multicopper oxidase domain-containing protein [Winogradskyella arenosi]
MLKNIIILLLLVLNSNSVIAQIGTNGDDRSEEGRPIKTYNLTIDQDEVTLAGVTADGMTVNGGIPAPTLEFTIGDLAIINVTNNMDVETSVHWHGIILPNFYDGVPYLTTPPIKPGTSFQYRIPINQTGTYWYHSHTMLQEQKGVYGSIVIQPKEKTLEYDKELVVVLSDWTNEKPENVLRNLKRGNEWYQIKKGTAVPLSRAIARGAFGAQLQMWRDRMEGADIADIYYPAFLSNGKAIANYPNFEVGEKVRLRFINASASTYFWLDFGAGNPQIVSSDGLDVQPVAKDRFLFAIAETYDVLVTIPDGTLEITATAQDGSGHTSIQLGEGKLFPAMVIDRPDKVAMMQQMAKMDMKMGAPSIVFNPKKKDPQFLKDRYGMKMDMNHNSMMMQNSTMKDSTTMQNMTMAGMEHHKHHQSTMQKEAMTFDHAMRKTYFNYDFLKAKTPTTFPEEAKVNTLLLNLTGNMNRYIWSMNGVPLAETDNIKINSGEVTRITFNNLTMMHHPMHLHGHYFRVINKNGERSPLKHTVNVPPMQELTIEFYNEEYGDWFFHCHVLYHMMSGMTRIFSYDTPTDERMEAYPVENLIHETNQYYHWGMARLGSNFNELTLTSSNIRNEFGLKAEFDYDENTEIEVSYNRYLNDWVRLYVAVNAENESPDIFDKVHTVGLAGVKYFTPYMFNVDLSIDHQLRPRIRLDKELLLFPRLFLEAEYEYRTDFGWVNDFEEDVNYKEETEWLVALSYILSRNFSVQGNYHNHYGWGGGVLVRF